MKSQSDLWRVMSPADRRLVRLARLFWWLDKWPFYLLSPKRWRDGMLP